MWSSFPPKTTYLFSRNNEISVFCRQPIVYGGLELINILRHHFYTDTSRVSWHTYFTDSFIFKDKWYDFWRLRTPFSINKF